MVQNLARDAPLAWACEVNVALRNAARHVALAECRAETTELLCLDVNSLTAPYLSAPRICSLSSQSNLMLRHALLRKFTKWLVFLGHLRDF